MGWAEENFQVKAEQISEQEVYPPGKSKCKTICSFEIKKTNVPIRMSKIRQIMRT